MTQMIELVDKNIKSYCNYILCVPEPKRKIKHIKQKCGRYKKAQVKLEIKTLMSNKNNSGMGLRVHQTFQGGEKIGELEDMATETIQYETQRENKDCKKKKKVNTLLVGCGTMLSGLIYM